MIDKERQRLAAQVAANCAPQSWARLRPVLAALHVPAAAGPDQVLGWLEEAFAPAQSEARRVILAISRQRWQALALPGPYKSARLGLRIVAGGNTWWLRFVSAPTLHVHTIERFSAQAGAA